MGEWRLFGTPGPTTLDKGSLSLTRSLDVPRVSRYDVDTETPRPERLVVDLDTTTGALKQLYSSESVRGARDISGKGNHGTFNGTNMNYSSTDKAFVFNGTDDYIDIVQLTPRDAISTATGTGVGTGAWVHSKSFWFKLRSSTDAGILFLLGTNGSTRQIAVQVNGAGQFQYFIYGCNSRVQVNGADWYPDVDRWYHCVTVFKNNETTANGSVLTGREMYIDGVKQTLVALNTQVSLNLNSSRVRFGNQFNTTYLQYQLSNPKLYSVALEPSEVQKLYRLGRTGRSMVISDTAVGIGKVPEAQLDVRGVAQFGSIYAPGTIIQVRTNSDTNSSTGYSALSYTTTDAAGSGNIPIARATGLKASITPRSKKSRIYADFHVLVYFPSMTNVTGARIQCWRKIGSTYTRVYGAPGGHDLHHYDNHTGSLHTYTRVSFVDNSPNTLQECEYELRAMLYGAANAGSLQLGNGGNQPANCILMEIGGE